VARGAPAFVLASDHAALASPSHSPLQNLRPKSRAIRVNPEGRGVVLCTWPRSITAIINKNKVTNWSRDDTKRKMVVSINGNSIKMSCGYRLVDSRSSRAAGSWELEAERAA
jgi:hypothetical protein